MWQLAFGENPFELQLLRACSAAYGSWAGSLQSLRQWYRVIFFGLIVAPLTWLILFKSLQMWQPEPAIDEWDKFPKEVRIAMLQAVHPAALQLARYDRDTEVQGLWRRTLSAK